MRRRLEDARTSALLHVGNPLPHGLMLTLNHHSIGPVIVSKTTSSFKIGLDAYGMF